MAAQWIEAKCDHIVAQNQNVSAWNIWFFMNSEKSCDLRSIMRNHNIKKNKKPCHVNSYSVISQHKEKMLYKEPKFLF